MFRIAVVEESKLFYLANSFLLAFIFNDDCASREEKLRTFNIERRRSQPAKGRLSSVLFLEKLLQLLEITFIHVFFFTILSVIPATFVCVSCTLNTQSLSNKAKKKCKRRATKVESLIHHRRASQKHSNKKQKAENVCNELRVCCESRKTGWMSGAL